jgi:hypothetical protein
MQTIQEALLLEVLTAGAVLVLAQMEVFQLAAMVLQAQSLAQVLCEAVVVVVSMMA